MNPRPETSTQRRPIRLLIIDDERDLVEILSLRFAATGAFSVETAPDGRVGLGKVKTFRPDLILLDILMPNMDGWEFCRKLREDPATRSLPVVVMTAVQGLETEALARAAGIHRVLMKPFVDRDIVSLLLEALPQSA